MVIRDIERDDIDFISKTLHCMPISHVDHMRPEKLGHASIVEEKQVRSLTLQSWPMECAQATPSSTQPRPDVHRAFRVDQPAK